MQHHALETAYAKQRLHMGLRLHAVAEDAEHARLRAGQRIHRQRGGGGSADPGELVGRHRGQRQPGGGVEEVDDELELAVQRRVDLGAEHVRQHRAHRADHGRAAGLRQGGATAGQDRRAALGEVFEGLAQRRELGRPTGRGQVPCHLRFGDRSHGATV